MQWKPGDEQVTVYLPENGIAPGDEIVLDGKKGYFVGLNQETGIMELQFDGNTEYFQAEPNVFTGNSNPLVTQ
ncbi:MAG: hypothetical protein R3A45_04265 [Bdellovibrionota bacterium]